MRPGDVQPDPPDVPLHWLVRWPAALLAGYLAARLVVHLVNARHFALGPALLAAGGGSVAVFAALQVFSPPPQRRDDRSFHALLAALLCIPLATTVLIRFGTQTLDALVFAAVLRVFTDGPW